MMKYMQRVALRQPLTLRRPCLHHDTRRTFRSSASTKTSILDVVTAPPLAFLDAVHSCGLPWWAVIPSTALAVRSLVFFMTSRASHQRARMRNAVQPLARAQLENETLMRAVLQAQGLTGREKSLKTPPFWERTRFALRYRAGRLARSLDGDLFRWMYLANTTRIAAWLVANEAIRMKLGMDTAFLRAIYNSLMLGPTAGAGQSIAHFDVATQTEGLPWCTDLTVADPTGILQGGLFVITMINILAPVGRTPTKTWHDWRVGTTQQQWTFALCMTVIYSFTFHLPAGLHLYWLSSALVAKLQQAWLHLKYPMPQAVDKCKIPARFEVSNIRQPRSKGLP